MKQTPELDRIQARMQPGVITLHGFLGHDERKLADIIAADRLTLDRLGVTAAQIADRLADLTRRGTDLMEAEVELDGRFAVTVRDDRGVLPSPWGDGRFGKGDTEVLDRPTGRRFRFNELTLHLARTYGFFSGVGSDYRLDPAELVELLGIRPDTGQERG